jgi:hypothetical protein
MTPNNIAGMAALSGIQIMALTDHNTLKNCPAFFKAAKKNGVIPIAGVELTTAEDIHVVCLFPDLDTAMSFDSELEKHRILIPNRTDIFGNQLILDEEDNLIGVEPNLLSNATDITVDESFDFIKKHGGVCYPAHIDRQANGIIATLGAFPEIPQFNCAELVDFSKLDNLLSQFPILKEKLMLFGSDAHYLWDIPDKEHYLELDDEPYSSALVRENLFKRLGL